MNLTIRQELKEILRREYEYNNNLKRIIGIADSQELIALALIAILKKFDY